MHKAQALCAALSAYAQRPPCRHARPPRIQRGGLPELLEDYEVSLFLAYLGEHGHLNDLHYARPERIDRPAALLELLRFQPAFHGDGTTADLEERHAILRDHRQSGHSPRRHDVVSAAMLRAEILHPGIRDVNAIKGEALDRVLQEPGLLPGRFYEGRCELGLHDLYRDAWKPTTTTHVGQPPGMRQRPMQQATQRIENVGQHDLVYVPRTDDVRKIIAGEKTGVLQQTLWTTMAKTQPPGRHLRL